MEEKSKVEQFEEKLEELINDGDVTFDHYVSDVDAALKLMDDLDPTDAEKSDMKDILDEYEAESISYYWDDVTKRLHEYVSRYGGDTSVIEECVEYYRREGYPEDSVVQNIEEFIDLEEIERIFWNFYFMFFPDSRVPEGQTTLEFLQEQEQLMFARKLAFSSISAFLTCVAEIIVQIRYGNVFSQEEFWRIEDLNDFASFYPEFIELFQEARIATKERTKEIRKHCRSIGPQLESIATRLHKITPELVIPAEFKHKIKNSVF